MKVTELNKELIEEITGTSRYLIQAINSYIKKHKVTQTTIGQNLNMVQSTVSKILSENNITELTDCYSNLSVSDARKISMAMGTTLGTVLYEYEQHSAQNFPIYSQKESQEYFSQQINENIPEQCDSIPSENNTVYPSCLFSDEALLVNRKTDPMFSKWFGTYYCYFFSTLSTETECFEGKLEIPEHPQEGCCHVKFSFAYGKKKNRYKRYYGQLVLSRKPTGGAYCTLVNHDKLGEISFLVMANPIVNDGSVCCVVALVATISGGKDTKHPCAERMIISREPLKGQRFELAKAHLLLNDKSIRITEEDFLRMLDTDSIPEEFKLCYKTEHPFDEMPLSAYLTKTAVIPESWVKSLTNFTEEERQIIIDLLRLYSSAPKYNKIKQKTVEYDIYNLFREEYEPWTHSSESE